MEVIRLYILKDVLRILEIETYVKNLLFDNGNSSARNILNTMNKDYKYLEDKEKSKLFSVDRDLIIIYLA